MSKHKKERKIAAIKNGINRIEHIEMERSEDKQYKRLERVVYVLLWVIIAMIPVVGQLYEYLNGSDVTFEFNKVVKVWGFILPFFILFWLHDLFLIRLLLHRGAKTKVLYVAVTVAMIIGMISIISSPSKKHRHERTPEALEQVDNKVEVKIDSVVVVASGQNAEQGVNTKKTHRRGGPRGVKTMIILTNTIFALFAVSLNIAVKLYFRAMSSRRRIARLEAENTSTRLQFLKYQINPHFFMNTLNNIHALIDIDSAKAQNVVVELSKMMRYVLYEIDKDNVTLRQEVDFLNNYIKLMRIRLKDNVEITVDISNGNSDIKLPPLLFIPFVENIFKHGISYRELSKVEISLHLAGDKLVFRSKNSNHANHREDSHHGIGLENLRRRLDLLYGDEYQLTIREDSAIYEVELTLPVAVEENKE